MDEARFDALTRTLGTTHSRRRLTRLLGGLSLGGVLSALGGDDAAAALLLGGARCTRKAECKSGRCLNPDRCDCTKQGCTCTCACSKTTDPPVRCMTPVNPCRKNVCTDTGRCVLKPKCADSNPCTDDLCDNGVCSHPHKPNGLDCPGGKCLDGTCEPPECSVPADCPGTDTDCQTRTCSDGVCGLSFAPAGTAITAQTAGDCQKTVCDGSGGTTNVADNSDLPDDGKDCTEDTCSGGTPQFANRPVGFGCTVNGQPGECDGAGICAPVPTCSDLVKNGSETDIDCGGTCPPCAIDQACQVNTDCVSARCVDQVCQPA